MKNDETYQAVWDSVLKKCQDVVAKGVSFYPQIETLLSDTAPSRKEFSLGSRYLPRGFYCPSPDMELIITNMRRGRIAKRLTKASKPTNSYQFNRENKLLLAETFYSNGAVQTEYILHTHNASYGFTYDRDCRITGISIEEYADNTLLSYLWAACSYRETTGYRFFRCIYETFHYLDCGQLETDFYLLEAPMDEVFLSRWKAVFDLDENGAISPGSRTLLLYEKEKLQGETD